MVEVTQADRDAAAPFMPYLVLDISETSFAQAFARHREQTTAAIVAWLRGQADWYDNADDGWSHYDSKAQALRDEADAIERGEQRQAQETTDEQ